MKLIKYLLTVILALYSVVLYGQSNICGTPTEYYNESIEEHTKTFTQQFGPENNVIVTIPVVVHVVWNTMAQNLSGAQINSAIIALNLDFAKLNADTINTPTIFKSSAGKTNIQFCLAKRNPYGELTDGIVRVQTTITTFSSNDDIKFSNKGGSNAWDRNKYLNIWLGNLSGGLGGYAQFPGAPAATDGIVIHYGYFGTIGTLTAPAVYGKNRIATHEVGHWLNLRHIWGDSPCGDDLVNDTPTQNTANYYCPTFPLYSNCTGNNPTGDMFMNYMDYTYDHCKNLFSNGQVTRMEALFSDGGFRNSLLTSDGCTPGVTVSCSNVDVLTTSFIEFNYAIITWSYVPNAINYKLRYKLSGSPIWGASETVTGTIKTIQNLIDGVSYTVQVKSICSNGDSSEYVETSFSTPKLPNPNCEAVSFATVSVLNSSSAQINFTVPVSNATYRIRYRYHNSNSSWIYKNNIKSGDTLINLGFAYYEYQIITICSSVDSSIYSTIRVFGMGGMIGPLGCQPPINVIVDNITTQSATLTWTQIVSAGYTFVYYKREAEVYYTTANVFVGSATTYTLINLLPDIRYVARVQGYCEYTGEYSKDIFFTTQSTTPPPPPVLCIVPYNLSNSNPTWQSADLYWKSDNSTFEIQYRIQGNSNWQLITSNNKTAYLGDLQSSTKYEWRVRAVCGTTTSSYSEIAMFRTKKQGKGHFIPLEEVSIGIVIKDISVFDITGRKLNCQSSYDNEYLTIDSCSTGILIVRVTYSDNTFIYFKTIK